MRLDLDIDKDIDSLITMFKDAPQKNQVAINRALKKLSRWTERRVYREVAANVQVTQKILKEINRVKVSLYQASTAQNKAFSLIVWIGTYDIPAHKLGKPVQTKAGVKTGKHFWKSAFTLQPLGVTKDLVFKRTPDWKHTLQRSRNSGRMMYMGLPLEKQALPMYQSAHSAVKKIQPQLLERFATLLQQELNYVFSINN